MPKKLQNVSEVQVCDHRHKNSWLQVAIQIRFHLIPSLELSDKLWISNVIDLKRN